MKVRSTEVWEENFFRDFFPLHNEINRDHPYFRGEDLETFIQNFAPDSAFSANHAWKAFLIKGIGRCIVSIPKNEPQFACFGYFEIRKGHIEEAKVLLEEAKQWVQTKGIKEIRGPIQGNIFNSYKFKLPSKNRVFGDPVHPEFYPQYFEDMGFKECGRWGNMKLSPLGYGLQLATAFLEINKTKGLVAREFRPDKLDQDIEILHSLMMDSYQNMHSFEQCSLEEFKNWNQFFLQYISPDQFLIVEYNGEPVGFVVNVFENIFYEGKLEKRMLLSFVGRKRKLPAEVKGVTNCITRFTLSNRGNQNYRKPPVLTSVYEKSPIRYWMKKLGTKEITEYALYSIKIEN